MNNKKLTPKDLDNYAYILEVNLQVPEIPKKQPITVVVKELPKVELPSRRSDD